MNSESQAKGWNVGVAVIVAISGLIVGGFIAYVLWAMLRGAGFAWLPTTRLERFVSAVCCGFWILYRAARVD